MFFQYTVASHLEITRGGVIIQKWTRGICAHWRKKFEDEERQAMLSFRGRTLVECCRVREAAGSVTLVGQWNDMRFSDCR
jgi:hypothetical protein